MYVTSAGKKILGLCCMVGLFIRSRNAINNQLLGQCNIGKVETSAVLVGTVCGIESRTVRYIPSFSSVGR